MSINLHDVTTALPEARKGAEKSERRPMAALTIISHTRLSRAGQTAFLSMRKPTCVSRNGPDFTFPDQTWGEPLNDPFISRTPILFEHLAEGVRIDNGQVARGLLVDGVSCRSEMVVDKKRLEKGVVLELAGRICLLLHLRDIRTEFVGTNSRLLGYSEAINRLRTDIRNVASLSTPILLLGPSGSGKELVAAELATGRDPKAPFVKVNMAAIPGNLAASELFGVRRGAYTGAGDDRPGFFASANGGTLFLDEIGETSREIQPLLLRALETGEIQAVGAADIRKVKVRVIAATDSNLTSMVAAKRFSAPLFHRLSGYEILVPGLAERREDVGVLLNHFARTCFQETDLVQRLDPADPHAPPWLAAAIAAQLTRYDWPGNVRQLRNVVNQLVIGNRGRETFELSPALQNLMPSTPERPRGRGSAELSESEIIQGLTANRWEIKTTAANLGLSRAALYRRIKHCNGIAKAADLDRETLEAAYQACDGALDAMVDRLKISEPALRRRLHQLGIYS